MTVTATLGQVSKSVTFQILSTAGPTLQALSIVPDQVPLASLPADITVTATLTEPAPAGGLQIALTVPPPVVPHGALTVPSGATTGQIVVEISAVPGPLTVIVTGTLGQVSKSATFQITP